MSYKALIERTKNLTQRKGTIDKDINFILDSYISLVSLILVLITISCIISLFQKGVSIVPTILLHIVIIGSFIWYYKNKYRKIEDKLEFFLKDFYSAETRREILEKEIDEFAPEVLSGEISDYKDLVTFISVGDLCYKVIPYYSSYRVMLYDKNLGEFKSLEKATSFATNRIRKSIKERLGIL